MPLAKFIPAVILAVFCTAALAAAALHAPTAPGAPIAILFPPRTPLLDAVAAVGVAGGRVERTGRWDNVVVASFPGREPPVGALESAGAWLVFNAIAAGGCDPAALQLREQPFPANRLSRDKGLES